MRRYSFTTIFILMIVLLIHNVGQAQQSGKRSPKVTQTQTPKETPLTNQDILKLTKLGLKDEVIIAKIKQAKEVNFNLDTESLIMLKNGGVRDDVISAMLNRSTSPSSGSAAFDQSTPSPSPDQSTPSPSPDQSAILKIFSKNIETASVVKLISKDGEFELNKQLGRYSRAGFIFYAKFFNYPGLKANVRIKDSKPTFLLRLRYDPTGNAAIVKLKPEQEDNFRSLKLGKVGQPFGTTKGFMLPDKDWTIPFQAMEEDNKNNIWRLTISQDLEPGEYGVYVPMEGVEIGYLYDFGID